MDEKKSFKATRRDLYIGAIGVILTHFILPFLIKFILDRIEQPSFYEIKY
ncbi:MAG: hypothetical protein QXJ75_04505 [Candidatus Bathyarchaeia archaeon]